MDQTKQKDYELRLEEKIQALQEASRQKNEFLAMMGHELRNLLAAMKSGLRVLHHPVPDAMKTRVIDVLHQQADHVVRLVDDLLDVTRIIRGRVEIRVEKIAIQDIIRAAVEVAWPAMEENRTRIEVQMPEQDVLVSGDKDRLIQVFGNLLTNCARYAPGGSAVISLERHECTASVRVKDTGRGIRSWDWIDSRQEFGSDAWRCNPGIQ